MIPIPNSIAERTRTKNVKETMFRLSNTNPIKRQIAYSVIHNNSAVNNKCRDVFVLITILNRSKKKKIINKFKLSTIINFLM